MRSSASPRALIVTLDLRAARTYSFSLAFQYFLLRFFCFYFPFVPVPSSFGIFIRFIFFTLHCLSGAQPHLRFTRACASYYFCLTFFVALFHTCSPLCSLTPVALLSWRILTYRKAPSRFRWSLSSLAGQNSLQPTGYVQPQNFCTAARATVRFPHSLSFFLSFFFFLLILGSTTRINRLFESEIAIDSADETTAREKNKRREEALKKDIARKE